MSMVSSSPVSKSARAVIPTIISQLLEGERLRLGSLLPTRDFSFVTDTVAAMLAAAKAPESAIGSVLNVGAGKEID